MARPLKLLLVEDNAADAELMLLELRRAGFAPRWDRVDSEAEFLALLRPELDVVISDFSMPQFSGLRALELLKESRPEVPFILVSGALGEDTAVTAMREGASDYLIKDRLTRLGPAVARALEQSQLRRERAQAERALRASEARFHGLLDNMLEGCQIISPDWRYLYLNETAARHGQRRREELLGRTVQECYPGFDQSPVFRVIERCMIERTGTRIESDFMQPDGSLSCFELSIQPVPEGLFILSLDISDRKRALVQLRDSEERFRQLAENINEVFWMTDPTKHAMLYISPGYEHVWGRSCASLYQNPLNWIDAIYADDRRRVIDAVQRQSEGKYDETYRIVRPDGSLRWIRDRAFPVRNEAGEVYRMVGTAADITEQHRAELRTRLEHDITAVLAEGTTLVATARRILETICQRLDWDIGDLWTVDRVTKKLRCIEIWHRPEPDFAPFERASRALEFAIGEGFPGQVWALKAPKSVEDVPPGQSVVPFRPGRELGLRSALGFPIKVRDSVYGVMEFFSRHPRPEDRPLVEMFVTLGTQFGQFIERKQFEEQFRQAQKMEAIGTLAGGIAHDFNNVLGAITGYAELAKMDSRDRPEVVEYLQAVLAGTRRGADLVRQILAFSRKQETRRVPVHLRPILEEALKLMRAAIPATIEFQTTLAPHSPSILADSTQIHQVIVNLVTNAAHAMRNESGRLGVILENVEVDPTLAALHPGLRPGRYVRLCISDTGHGMDEATVSRIFDPFFTTKAPGEGTGLGLAVVHGIMQSLEGAITVYSRPGQGARFNLYFPAHETDASPAGTPSSEPIRGSGQRILVIDDELPLATMAKKILDRLGYRTDAMASAAEALAAIQADPTRYDLVITDLTMPSMTGVELSTQLLQLRPDLPVVLTTGYSASMTESRVRALGLREMMLKPLSVQSLADVVHRVLAQPKPSTPPAAS